MVKHRQQHMVEHRQETLSTIIKTHCQKSSNNMVKHRQTTCSTIVLKSLSQIVNERMRNARASILLAVRTSGRHPVHVWNMSTPVSEATSPTPGLPPGLDLPAGRDGA
jgi:hypothetical protein